MEVKHGPSGEDGELPASRDLEDSVCGIFLELARGVAFRGIQDVNQVMWDPVALGQIRFGRPNIHASKDQSRIDADDLAPQPLCESDGQAGFPDAVGPMMRRALGLDVSALIPGRCVDVSCIADYNNRLYSLLRN